MTMEAFHGTTRMTGLDIRWSRATQFFRDAAHLPFLQAAAMGLEREVVEKECLNCHSAGVAPLPSSHPPKEECLICHAGQG